MPGPPQTFHLPHIVATGAEQMAIDEALLAWAAATSPRLVFRTYGWSRPTLSLGRGEPFPVGWDAASMERDGIDVVRRPTGGDAVLHDEELTFAVAASLPGPWGSRPRAFANLVADALADTLRELGLDAGRVPAGSEPPALAVAGAYPCFARTAPGEVRVGRFKVAGIACRFTRGGALSHASVPLSSRCRDVARYRERPDGEREELERHARSAPELLGRPLDQLRLGASLRDALSRRLGAPLTETTFEQLGLDGSPVGLPSIP